MAMPGKLVFAQKPLQKDRHNMQVLTALLNQYRQSIFPSAPA